VFDKMLLLTTKNTKNTKNGQTVFKQLLAECMIMGDSQKEKESNFVQ